MAVGNKKAVGYQTHRAIISKRRQEGHFSSIFRNGTRILQMVLQCDPVYY